MFRFLPAIPLLVFAGAPAVAAETPLEAIPQEAGVVLRLKQPTKTTDKVVALVKNVDPQLVPAVQAGIAQLGLVISNPTMRGVDQDRDWWAVAFPQAGGEPRLAFVVPAKDAAAMKQAVGASFTFAQHGRWQIYSEDSETVKKFSAVISGEAKSMAELVDERSQKVFDDGDASVFVNVDHLKTVYAGSLDQARGEIDKAIQQLQNMAVPAQGIDTGPIFELYGDMAHGFLRGVEDTRALTVGVGIASSGVTIEEFVVVEPGSATQKVLAANEPSALATMEKLPPGQLIYAGFHGDTQTLVDWGLKFSSSMMQGDAEQQKKIEAAGEVLKEVEFGDYALSFGLDRIEGGALRSTVITQGKPIEKLRDFTRKQFETWTVEAAGIRQSIDLKPKAETVEGQEIDLLTLKQEFDPAAAPFADVQKKVNEALYGPQGLQARTAYPQGMVLQTMGGGKAAMQEALVRLQSQSDEDRNEAVQTARGQTLESANVLVMVDMPSLILDAVRLVIESGQVPIPLNPAMLKQLGVERSYLVFAMRTEENALRAKTHVPAKHAKNIAILVRFAQQFSQGAGGL